MENYIVVKIKKGNKFVKTPKYAKIGDFGMDLVCTSIVYNEEYDFYEFHTGIYCEFPDNVGAYLMPRSSNRKTEAYLCNSCGLIDEGYRGELIFCYKNRTSYEVRCMLEEWKHMKSLTEGITFDSEKNIGETVSQIKSRGAEPFRKPDPMEFLPYKVGDRVGQIFFVKLPSVTLTEVDELSESERGTGGFGHTGN